MATAEQVAENIQTRVYDDGFWGTDRNDNLKETVQDLKELPTAYRDAVASLLTDDDLQALADDVNSSGWLGAGGLSADEKRDFFNILSQGLSGKQLGRIAKAFDNRDDIVTLGQAVAQHGDSAAKLGFVQEMAPRTADGDKKISAHFGSTTVHNSDKDAIAIAEVLSSLGNDPTIFNAAVRFLDDKTLQAVAAAGLDSRTTTYATGGYIPAQSVRFNPQRLNALAEAAASSSDPSVKAKIMDAGSTALKQARHEMGDFPELPNNAKDAFSSVADTFSSLIETDSNGITRELNTRHDIEASETEWTNQLQAWSSQDMLNHFRGDSGDAVTMTEIGHSTALKEVVDKDGAFDRDDSIQGRFINDIVSGQASKDKNGNYYFENAYDFGSEMIWAMGDGMSKGTFRGEIIHNKDGTATLDGVIEYEYSDKFTDPYDVFDVIPGENNLGGAPYDVRENWTVDIMQTEQK